MMNKREKYIANYTATLPYVIFTVVWIVLVTSLISINEKYNDICIGLTIGWGIYTLLFLVFNSPFHINNMLDKYQEE